MYYRRKEEIEINKRLEGTTRPYVSGVYFNEDRNRYLRYWRSKNSKVLKKLCNRKFRRTNKCVVGKNNNYRKATEFWWAYL